MPTYRIHKPLTTAVQALHRHSRQHGGTTPDRRPPPTELLVWERIGGPARTRRASVTQVVVPR